jgi:Flp pilus assembly protein TadD
MKNTQFGEAVERLTTAAALAAPIDVHLHLAEAYAALGRTEDSGRARNEYESLKRDAIRRDGASR